MRLSKTAWLILGTGVFIIALVALFMLYSNQASDEEQMEESLAEAQALLPQLMAEKEEWQSQLTQLESQLLQEVSALEKSIARFPEAVESIENTEELFLIAHDCDLEVVKIDAKAPYEQEVADTPIIFSVTYLEVHVSPAEAPPLPLTETYLDSTVADILDFIDTVVNGGYFTTATVEQVIWEIPELEETEKPLAIIKLNIYGYEAYEVYEEEVDEGE